MARTVTLEFDGPPFKRHEFPLYGGKLRMGRVEAVFGLQRVHVNNLLLGIDPQGLSREEFQPGAVIKITGTMAAGLGPTGREEGSSGPSVHPVRLLIVYEKAKDKAKVACEYAFPKRPSLARVRQLVEEKHEELQRKAYALKSGRLDITDEAWPALDLKPPRKSKHFTITVLPLSKAFSSFSKHEGFSMLGVRGPSTQGAEAAFAADELNDDQELPAEMQQRTQWKTIKDVLLHLANDMARRAYVSRTFESGKELVSPFLMAAATIVPEIQVLAEFNVEGTRAHGHVDWVVLFKMFCIVIVEAKLNAPFAQYLGQLAAEMVSAREDYAITELGKRVHEAAAALPQVPSYGILTNGQNMQFYKYSTSSTGERVLQASELVQVHIDGSTSWEAALAAVKPVVGMLVHILRAQVSELNKCPEAKKPRIGA